MICARSFSCWLLSWCSLRSREQISPTRSEPWTEAETTAAIRNGERRTRSICGLPGRTTPTGLRSRSAGRRPGTSATASYNDTHQNLFSENGVTQWGFVWGQFMDHTFGLREEAGGENAPIAFNKTDPLETFTNTLGSIAFTRTPAAPAPGRERSRGSRSTRSRATSTASASTAALPTGSSGCARGRWTEGSPTTARSCCCRTASCLAPISAVTPRRRRQMALMGRLEAPGAFAKALRRRGQAGEREHRALVHPHPVRAGAQPDRLDSCRAGPARRAEVPDRPPGDRG